MENLPAALLLLGYAHVALTSVLVALVLLRKKEPVATVAWMLAIALLPYLGGLFFLVFGNNRVERKARRKRLSDEAISPRFPDLSAYHVSHVGDGSVHSNSHLMALASKVAETHPTTGNDVEILVDTNRTFGLLEKAIRAAKNHIHLDYYIFQPDDTGRRFRDLLIEKAREGVQVRFLYDAVGSLRLNRSFLAPLHRAGVQVACFLPVNPLRRRLTINLRNHRKILIVDGRVGFTGGVNIGSEYVGRNRHLGYWRDTHVALRGPAVLQLQQVFAEDWFFATDEELVGGDVFPSPQQAGDEVVQVIAGGPDRPVEVFHEVFFTAINTARERVLLETSYFVPPESLRLALTTAAHRGVEVRLLLPARSAHATVLRAAESYYESLLAAGVQIYQYDRGLLHSKLLAVDGRWSFVGSANFDNRSLRLNFEVGLLFYGTAMTAKLEQVFERDLRFSRGIGQDAWAQRSMLRRLGESTCRLLSPIL